MIALFTRILFPLLSWIRKRIGSLFYKPGAGILPFTIHNSQIVFLFHQTHRGKKVGFFVDFGGAIDVNDVDSFYTACREFNEETAGLLYLSKRELENIKILGTEKEIAKNVKQATEIMYQELKNVHKWMIEHPFSGYKLYITPIQRYMDASVLNKYYETAEKKRTFSWIKIDDLISEKISLHPRIIGNEKFHQILEKIYTQGAHPLNIFESNTGSIA